MAVQVAEGITEPFWVVRDRAAAHRDRMAQERDTWARERDDDARRRDLEAYQRDRSAAERDRLARRRDRAATARDDPRPCVEDRLVAARGRSSAALDRRRASDDRREASLDRHMSSLDRWQAAVDRMHTVDDRQAARAEHARLATDDLTGLLRRTPGLPRLQAEVDRAHRTGGSLSAAFVDVDGLKTVNDRDGHHDGDALLSRVATALRDSMRSYDVVFRYGGDEFVCGMVDVPATVAEARFDLVRRALAPHHASVTFGVAELRAGESAEELVARADTELVSKRHGRDVQVRGQVTLREQPVFGDSRA